MLRTTGRPVGLSELSDELELLEHLEDTLPERPESLARESGRARTDISLVHVHLPMLDDSGLVQWDRSTNTVCLSPEAGRIPAAFTSDETTVGRVLGVE